MSFNTVLCSRLSSFSSISTSFFVSKNIYNSSLVSYTTSLTFSSDTKKPLNLKWRSHREKLLPRPQVVPIDTNPPLRIKKKYATTTFLYDSPKQFWESKGIITTDSEKNDFTRIDLDVVDWSTNKVISKVSVSRTVFQVPLRIDFLHRVVLWQRACKRQGTASAKTRAEVSGSGKKMRPQKGGGTSRVGDKRTPLWKGGGVVHPPKPRDFSYTLPRRIIKQGVRVAFSYKLAQNKLIIIEDSTLPNHKTRSISNYLTNLTNPTTTEPLDGETLLITDNYNFNLKVSSLNYRKIDVMDQRGVNVYDIMNHKTILITKGALEYIHQTYDIPTTPLYRPVTKESIQKQTTL